MLQPRMTNKAMREMDAKFKLQHEALEIFKQVVAEWETDAMSVQCFDLRMVEKAKSIVLRLKKVDPLFF